MSLRPVEVDYLRRLLADLPKRRAYSQVALALSLDHGIGKQAPGFKYFVYESKDHQAAQSILINRGYDLKSPDASFTRSEAPSGGSEKRGALSVSAGLMATRFFDGRQWEEGAFVARSSAQVLAKPHTATLVCENLEALLCLHEYRWLQAQLTGRSVACIYRGGPGMFQVDSCARHLEAAGTPVLAFTDFDPQGLIIALSMPRLESVCLPGIDQLRIAVQAMRREHLFTDQTAAWATLRRRRSSGELPTQLIPFVDLLGQLQCGLNQEAFPRHESINKTRQEL